MLPAPYKAVDAASLGLELEISRSHHPLVQLRDPGLSRKLSKPDRVRQRRYFRHPSPVLENQTLLCRGCDFRPTACQ